MRKLLLIAGVLVLGGELSHAQAYKTEHGQAVFESRVPLHSFKGTSNHLVGKIDLETSTVDFYIDLNTLDTGIEKRDKDMRQTLETEKYPFAEFFGKLISPFDPSISDTQSVTVNGEFAVHGVSNEIEVDGTLYKNGSELHIRASWTLELDDYNIDPPGILFYRVDQQQKISIDALLKPIKDQ